MNTSRETKNLKKIINEENEEFVCIYFEINFFFFFAIKYIIILSAIC